MTAPLRVGVLTIFPELIASFAAESILGRAQHSGLLELDVVDLRSATTDPHRSVDDTPFGGGAGMVLMPEPVEAAIAAADPPRPLLYLSPAGRVFDQHAAEELAATGSFSLLCGRYEGVDERIRNNVDGELSVGDVVLAGGEAAALVVLEAVARLVPGVLGNRTSVDDESFADGLLEYPHYTRPADHAGQVVPEVLRSGHHGDIADWRHAAALVRTHERRPELLARRGVDERDLAAVERWYGRRYALVFGSYPPRRRTPH